MEMTKRVIVEILNDEDGYETVKLFCEEYRKDTDYYVVTGVFEGNMEYVFFPFIRKGSTKILKIYYPDDYPEYFI